MRVAFCGVRGSTPASGAEYVRYGGSTSCVAIGERPRLILDAGTGLRNASALLGGEPFEGTILLTHLHWDHTQGLPFFRAGDDPDASTRLLMPCGRDVWDRFMSPPHFPVTIDELRGSWRTESLEPGGMDAEGFAVEVIEIPHKGGRTFGYRISDGRSVIAYMPDHSPIAGGPGPDGLGVMHDAALQLAEGVDLLIHDAQHTAAEFPSRAHFGHASIEYAIELGRQARAKRVALFHHDPSRTDLQLDEIVDTYDALVAVEGNALDV